MTGNREGRASTRTGRSGAGVLLAGALALGATTLGSAAVGAGEATAAEAPRVATASARSLPTDITNGWWYDQLHLRRNQLQSGAGKGVTVAVIDSAIYLKDPDLVGARISLKRDCRDVAGYEPESQDDQDAAHGTSMTANIVGTGRRPDGKPGLLGVAPEAKVLFYPLSYLDAKDRPGGYANVDCSEVEMGNPIKRAVDDGADIISISIGSSSSSQIDSAIRYAQRKNVVVVAATGDTSAVQYDLGNQRIKEHIEFPAAVPGVVAAQAIDSDGVPWKYNPPPYKSSRYATARYPRTLFPVISAPGVDMAGVERTSDDGWVSDQSTTGTSNSTSVVAGLLALVKSKYPEATGNQLIQSLIHDTGGTAPYKWDRRYGFGIASATEMLKHDPTKWPDVNPLLDGPTAAMKQFPASVYGKTDLYSAEAAAATVGRAEGPTSKDKEPGPRFLPQPASKADQASTSATASASPQQSAKNDSKQRSSADSQSGSGPPTWVWLALVVVVLVLGGLAMAMTRGRRTATGRSAGGRS